MITQPTERMTGECLHELANTTAVTNPCLSLAVNLFKAQAADSNFNEKWGRDLNVLHGTHLLLDDTLAAPIFQREMPKAGDISSVCVSGNSLDGNMPSNQASSMRQLYDLWNNTKYMHVALPGGESGNPYSGFYQNLWEKYMKSEYVLVPITQEALGTTQLHASQKLSAK
uniref:Acyl-homoserine lactone acylase quiP n=1 Tax=Lygus hesperus TaxID=30085 RepID=A0A0A9YZ09_LYGHE